MAFYQCLVPVGSLDADTRAAAAEAITTVHSAVIGVAREFVNVVFTEYDPTVFYTAGRPHVLDMRARWGRTLDRAIRFLVLGHRPSIASDLGEPERGRSRFHHGSRDDPA